MQKHEPTQISSNVVFNETHCGYCYCETGAVIVQKCGKCGRPFCNMKRRNCLEQHQKETGHTND